MKRWCWPLRISSHATVTLPKICAIAESRSCKCGIGDKVQGTGYGVQSRGLLHTKGARMLSLCVAVVRITLSSILRLQAQRGHVGRVPIGHCIEVGRHGHLKGRVVGVAFLVDRLLLNLL